MGILNPNSTSYVHPNEPNLTRLENAMKYNSDGEPVIRTHVDGITLEGNLIVSNVVIDSGNIVVWQGNYPWIVKGNVDVVGNISGITTLPSITGNVNVNNFPAFPSNTNITWESWKIIYIYVTSN